MRQSFRTELLEEALEFTRKASRLLGITRIALIGSLTTDKADPKDVDMLVSVEDDEELVLAPLRASE